MIFFTVVPQSFSNCCRHLTVVTVELSWEAHVCAVALFMKQQLCVRRCTVTVFMLSHRGSLWALQRFISKHGVLCSISHAPDLHGRLTTSGFVAEIGVRTSCFLLVSCFCSYTTWTDMHLSLMWMLARWVGSHRPALLCSKKQKLDVQSVAQQSWINENFFCISPHILFIYQHISCV